MKAPEGKLGDALNAIDWGAAVATFLSDNKRSRATYDVNLRLAIWARQLETADKGNAALCFIREMQTAGQHTAALIALAMYKPAAASMRSMFETALYYTYFRTHSVELATLVREKRFFIDKREIPEFHRQHTNGFHKCQESLGLLTNLEGWYGSISAIVHGQIPGKWITYTRLRDIKHHQDLLPEVLSTFTLGGDVVHRLFLCTVGRELWNAFTTPAKKALLSGIAGSAKSALGLDAS